jgi:hypothetical protein
MISRFLRRMPLWQVPIGLLLGLALVYAASLIGLGGRFYLGDTLALTGLALYLAALVVAAYGYLYPALSRLGIF